MEHNVYQLIAEKFSLMSKSQKKIASYVLEHTNTVPFFNVANLAAETGVAKATVVRFAVFLGYSGYPELQQDMQHSVKQQLSTTERLRMSSQIVEGKDQIIYDIFHRDQENIQSTMQQLDEKSFLKAVEALLEAKNIYISANRSASSLGVFLQYYLSIMLGNSEMVSTVEDSAEQLYELGENDVVFAISYSRYTMSTINMAAYAKQQGATTIVLTDSLLSPLIPHADIALTASSQLPTFIDSFIAPLSLINALVAVIGKERMREVEMRLEKFEDIWDKLDIFYKKDD
ncbi:MurR/RpiR family transcriptional regulator [Halobacillus shinanisalinarum]|uniref:MurR/RpiR family transcriptional regulator n=1 Tax=Halobacillus shinanisalinarum TaxID=2932258 RepID=A0ABY4GY01_9BACI|nr:MurR/RpiR family transcriptional regulator [Halobacillus shinanisalinarum]UOQ92896.1 MurR/RpiR family transcriptional regulator [Halobacillus shinanisalinarum]